MCFGPVELKRSRSLKVYEVRFYCSIPHEHQLPLAPPKFLRSRDRATVPERGMPSTHSRSRFPRRKGAATNLNEQGTSNGSRPGMSCLGPQDGTGFP